MSPVERPHLEQTPDGRRVEVAREMAVPAATVWELLVRPARWPDWGPSVRAVECADERIVAGSSGRVRLPGGLWLPFEITGFRPLAAETAGRWGWEIREIPATGHRVEPRGDSCRAVFEIPPLAAGYAPVCYRALSKIEGLARED